MVQAVTVSIWAQDGHVIQRHASVQAWVHELLALPSLCKPAFTSVARGIGRALAWSAIAAAVSQCWPPLN